MTFFIAIFILLMQFLWKWIEDLVGKGLEWYVLAKIMIYASVSLVPMALPLAILLSSIMTFGNLSEQYELVACKAAGISLGKVMRPLIIFSVFVSLGAFFFSNNVMPYTNLKMNSLLYDVSHQKPALQIKEGVFYNGIEGYSIRVEKKEKDGVTLRNIMIYDHTEEKGNTKVTVAERGKMAMSKDERFLVVTLQNGYSYEERENNKYPRAKPFLRTHFLEQMVRFDLSTFKLTRTNEALFKDNFQMLNVRQLNFKLDTLKMQMQERKNEYLRNIASYYAMMRDSAKNAKLRKAVFTGDVTKELNPQERQRVCDIALGQARSLKSYIETTYQDLDLQTKTSYRNRVEWNLKFTLSFACLVLFFIGAPLGAIIRKGGFGMPVVVSTGFFVLFHILSITGKKFAQEGVLPVVEGMWMASAILFPIGVFLTYKATSDSNLFETEAYAKFFKRLFFWKKGKYLKR